MRGRGSVDHNDILSFSCGPVVYMKKKHTEKTLESI